MRLRKLISMREALESGGYFGRLLDGVSWAAWRAVLIAAMGEALTEDERVIFKGLTGREREPLEPVEQLDAVVGRRGGKTRAAATLTGYLAACVDHRDVLAPGERGVIPLMAASTQQAANAFAFVRGTFETAPNLIDLVIGSTSDTLSLLTGIDIQVRPASFRTIRGLTCVAALCDEIAFWRSEDTANPDSQVLQAIRPSLATTGGPLICISSPHAKRGELYNTFKRHFGPEGHPLVLVAKAPSWVMNPLLPQSVVDRAFEADPEAASAEYMAEFRNDISAFISRDAIEGAVSRGITVRAPLDGVNYCGFVDPSGGSSDSMAMGIGHREGERAVLMLLRSARRPSVPTLLSPSLPTC